MNQNKQRKRFRQLAAGMSLALMLCMSGVLSASPLQVQRMSVKLENGTLRELFHLIEEKFDYSFLVRNNDIDLNERLTLDVTDQPVENILTDALKKQDATFTVNNQRILVYKANGKQPRSYPVASSSSSSPAQQQQGKVVIKGKIIDESGEPLPGVSVYTKDMTSGTISDPDGKFSLPVNHANDSVYFSYVGYRTERILAQSYRNKNVLIKLVSNAVQMSELVVVAYGSTNRKTFTGSVSALTADDIQRNKSNNILSSLQGTIPGLRLENKSQRDGRSQPHIVIRGASSINSSISPLYIIDGAPSDAIEQLNPDDIESVSVLKDAVAISLYGARATNGVILISTKQGRRNTHQKASVRYTGQIGFSNRTGKDYKMVSPKDYYELSWEALRNGAEDNPGLLTAGGKKYASAAEYATSELLNVFGYNAYDKAQPVGLDGKLDPSAKLLWWEDYSESLIKTGLKHEHTFNINNATDKLKYYISAGYLNQKGLNPGNGGFDRFTARTNLSYEINRYVTVGINLGMSNSTTKTNSINNGYADFATYARLTPGLYPLYKRNEQGELVYDENGQRVLDFGNGPANILNSRRPNVTSQEGGCNPLGTLDLDKSRYKSRYYFTNFFVDVNLCEGLKFKTSYSGNTSYSDSKFYRNRTIGESKGKGLLIVNTSQTMHWTVNSILSYDKAWGSDHRLRLLLGSEINERANSSVNASATGFAFEGMDELVNGSTIVKPALGAGSSSSDRLVGFFSRAEYDLYNRYFFSASLRRDGSSRFHPDTRWGNFWSAGASWIISQEKFLQNCKWLSLLKLRVSYGTSGNIGTNDYRSYYATGYMFLGTPGVYISELANKNLKWEINKQLNVGIDAAFVNDRIRLTLDWYNRQTDDLFYNVPLSPSIGFKQVLRNIGSLRNRGLELSITTRNIQTKDFEWTTNFNISNNKNEILALNQDEFITGNRIYKVGQSTTEFFIREYAGVNPENGKPQWYIDEVSTQTGERTGNRVTTENWNETVIKTIKLDDGSTKTVRNLGRYSVGNYTPTISGGLYNTFRIGNFDLGILVNYSLGAKILMADYAPLTNSGSSTVKLFHHDMLNRWQKKGDVTDIPRLTTTSVNNYTGSFSYTSTFYMRSGDYLKLKTLHLGYMLPSKMNKALHIAGAQFYLQADNVCYFSAEQGFDPEQVSGGVVTNSFPTLSTYSVGVKLDF